MTSERDIERLLDRWFADRSTDVADRVLDEVADRIARQRQRPAWGLPWRDLHVNVYVRYAAAVTAIVILAVVGITALRPSGSSVGGPAATPSPSGSPTPLESATPSQGTTLCPTSEPACVGTLEAGRHRTDELMTPVSYAVPAGWSKSLDVPGAFNLGTDAYPSALIAVWPDWQIADQANCTADAEPGRGRTVTDLVSFLAEHPGLVTTPPQPATIGGLDGQVIDVSKDPQFEGCSGKVNLFTHRGTIDDVGWIDMPDGRQARYWFLDVGDGHVVNAAMENDDRDSVAAFLAEAEPIVESFDFSP